MPLRHLLLACIPFTLAHSALSAQAPSWSGTPAARYEERFRETWHVVPDETRGAEVKHLTLRRDGATLTLEEGRLFLLKPVGGQAMGALFRGKGRLSYTPSTRIEQERLTLFRKANSFDEPFEDLVLLFADTTLGELTRQLTFGPGAVPDGLKGRVGELFDYLGDEGDFSLDPDLLRPFLNGEASGLFAAMTINGANDPWVFEVNPYENEGIQLLTRAKHTGGNRRFEAVTMNYPRGASAPSGQYAERRPDVHIRSYIMDVRLPQTTTGELAFAADATLELVADTASGPWVAFNIFEKMRVDSASWADGTPAQAYVPKDSPYLWIRLDRRLEKGETRTLRLAYHGDLLDRFGDWFFIKASIAWYPLALENRYPALFDLTFTSPEGFLLASVGECSGSAGAPGHMIRTRWKTAEPIRNASFNLGLFERYDIRTDSAPSVTLLWSEDMHKRFVSIMRQGGQLMLQGKNMKEQVGQDVSTAIQFYTHVFGPPAFKHFYATEIPYFHGEAWPGVIGLSWVTFQQTSQEGFDQVFRAHEVGHQWWGIGVDYATYHDQWMSEGFSDFSGLWYLQTRRQSNDKYFDFLRRWKVDILLRRDDPIPIWLGYRVATSNTGEDYSAIVYQKGAYVVHMLRILLLDLKTMSETRFTETMRDFYHTYAGKRASTEDFRRMVEQHTGQDMGWFFDQWVYGIGIPTYKVAWKSEPTGDTWKVKLRVEQERVPPEFLAYVPVTVDLGGNRFARVRVKVTGARSEIDLPPLPAKPKDVKVNDFEGVLAEVKQVAW